MEYNKDYSMDEILHEHSPQETPEERLRRHGMLLRHHTQQITEMKSQIIDVLNSIKDLTDAVLRVNEALLGDKFGNPGLISTVQKSLIKDEKIVRYAVYIGGWGAGAACVIWLLLTVWEKLSAVGILK